VLIDFWAPWCGPCKMVTPVLERIARDRAGQLKVVKLNIDEAPEISARYGIQGIPLLVVLRDGEEVDRLAGAPPPAQLRHWLDERLAAAGSARSGR
jgi:thioredoxin 2